MPEIIINGSPLEISCKPGQVSDGYHTFDELYEHRCLLFCMLLTLGHYQEDLPLGWDTVSWKSRKHHDGSIMDGWFIAGMWLTGAEEARKPIERLIDPEFKNRSKIVSKLITYHLPDRMWDLAECEELESAPEWDGHTSQDVIDRLKWFLTEAK